MFTAGPIEFPSLVFLLIPLGGDQHILETCNYSHGVRHIQRLPSLAGHLFKACPKIYNFFVQLAFDEDQPIFAQHRCMQKFQAYLLKQTQRLITTQEPPKDPNLAIQGVYGQTFQGAYQQDRFKRLCHRAEQIGYALAG